MADDTKRIFCHACEEGSEVCPRCGDDFIEEVEAGSSPADLDDGGAAALLFGQAQPLLVLLSRLVQLRAQLAGDGSHELLLPLLAQLQQVQVGEGAPLLPVAGNPGDYVDDGRIDELLERLFQEEGARMTPASERVIERLQAEVTRMAASGVAAGTPCSVCQAAIKPGDNVLALGCKHPFHPECLLPWLKQSSTCPVCRFDVNEGEKEESEGDRASPTF